MDQHLLRMVIALVVLYQVSAMADDELEVRKLASMGSVSVASSIESIESNDEMPVDLCAEIISELEKFQREISRPSIH